MAKFLHKKYLLCFLLMLIGTASYTAEVTIHVIDTELEIPLEGVKIIETKSGNTMYTDENGTVTFTNNSNEPLLLISLLAGYQTKKTLLTGNEANLEIGMSIASTLEGKELVIEGQSPGKSDAQVGVSQVVEKNEMKATAQSGVIPDVMSTVKTLPGVIYSGKNSPNFSVRGGDPEGLTTVMDGFIVRHPWHWGGAFSIFNPNIVDSLKFSAGIFSAKYGPAMSGLMEVNTITPDDGLKAQMVLSTMTGEVLIQTPIVNEKSGLYIGGRITSNDVSFMIAKPILDANGITFTRSPYIYDGYFKWYFKPVDRFEWYINGFFGMDGIGMTYKNPGQDESKEIVNTFNFYWENIDSFANTGFKILPNDRVFINILGGFEYYHAKVNGTYVYKGTRKYSSEFVEWYNSNPLLADLATDRFTLDATSSFVEYIIEYSGQARMDIDIHINDRILLSTGIGGILERTEYSGNGKMWGIRYENGTPVFTQSLYEVDDENKNILKSFTYLTGNFIVIPNLFTVELGIRADHNLLIADKGYHLNTYPVPGPRLTMFLTPFKPNNFFDKVTFSLGTGIFSKTPNALSAYTEDIGLGDFEMSVTKACTTVTGVEMELPFTMKWKAEGYFKYVFDVFYMNNVQNDDNSSEIRVHTDGYGYVAGFDLSFERKMSKYLDGSLSYSFCYARYLLPETDGIEEKTSTDGEPTGRWFYPSYHRFHSMNLVLNARPASWITITSKFTVATGAPQSTYGDKEMFYATVKTNGTTQILELYTRKTSYDDSARTDVSLPLDLKVTFNHFIPHTKLYLEYYIGVEDLFAAIYSPESGVTTDLFTGEDTTAAESNFSGGVPSFSTGFTLNF